MTKRDRGQGGPWKRHTHRKPQRTSNDYNNWVWTRQKSEARNVIWVLHLGRRNPSTWCIFYGCPRHFSRKRDQKESSQNWNQHHSIECRWYKWQLTALGPYANPWNLSLNSILAKFWGDTRRQACSLLVKGWERSMFMDVHCTCFLMPWFCAFSDYWHAVRWK